MLPTDQPFSADGPSEEDAAALARLAAEWQRLEAWGDTLEAEAAAWRDELLAAADAQSLGEAIRRRG